MAPVTGKRTQAAAIAPPRSTHINTVVSTASQDRSSPLLITNQTAASSLLTDFTIRSAGRGISIMITVAARARTSMTRTGARCHPLSTRPGKSAAAQTPTRTCLSPTAPSPTRTLKSSTSTPSSSASATANPTSAAPPFLSKPMNRRYHTSDSLSGLT